MKSGALLGLAVVAISVGVGCGGSDDSSPMQSGRDGGTKDASRESGSLKDGSAKDAAATKDGAAGDAKGDVDPSAYFTGLPGWPAAKPDSNLAIDGGSDAAPNYVTGTDGVEYLCTTTEYSLTATPTQVVTFNPNVDVLWPGALLQGGPFQQGELVGLPITQRAPLTVSIPTLLSGNNSQVVPSPSVATVENAIGAIIDSAVSAGVMASSSVSYTQTEAYSTAQTTLDLGFSVSYVGDNLSGELNLASSANLNTVVGYFVQNMFTVTVPEPEQPSDFFVGFSDSTLSQLQAQGDVGPTNLPIYVASVVYGRIMMFSLSSSESTESIKSALQAQFSGVVASGSVNTAYSSLLSDASTTFNVVTVGGSAANAEELIQTGDPSKFFDSDPAISTGVPISYVVRNLSNNSVAAVSQTTDYSVKSCVATAIGPGANYYLVDPTDLSVKAYDTVGNSVPLTHPIDLTVLPPGITGETARAVGSSAIAYDSANDTLYVLVLVSGDTTSTAADYETVVEMFSPDGALNGGFVVYDTLLGITYDVTHDRLWFASRNDVVAYTPGGELISPIFEGSFNLGIYSPVNNALYFLRYTGTGITAESFGLYQTVTFPSGAFSAFLSATSDSLGNSSYGAYDSTHGELWLGTPGSATLWGYSPTGTLITSVPLQGHTNAIAYDSVDDQVAVVLDDGTVSLFQSNGKPIAIAAGAFSGFSASEGLAYRP
jgi:hypothetical protein